MKYVTNKLLTVESRARRYFEQFPFLQAFFAGIGVIIFWRGVWELADASGLSPIASIAVGSLILGAVGVFVQTFIGNTIIIKEVKQEEKIEARGIQKIEGDMTTETITLEAVSNKLDMLLKKLEEK